MEEDDYGIPVLHQEGNSLAETWERALVKLHTKGMPISTQYDKPGDPPSIDATMIMTIKHPDSEPVIHKAFPGGIEDLVEYDMEVREGIKDSWTRRPEDPLDPRWEYTYHGRIFDKQVPITESMRYRQQLSEEIKEEMRKRGIRILLDMPWVKFGKRKIGGKSEAIIHIDQIEACIEMLSQTPYTRRAQVTTWEPEEDLVSYDPPCLQSMWWRISKGRDGKQRLCTDVRIRSNDAYGASLMNIFVFIRIAREIARRVSENIGEPILLGRYVHMADSFHIYGKDIKDFENRFLHLLATRSFEERIYRMDDPNVQDIFEETRPKVFEKIRAQTARYKAEKGE
jgi:thymidylate synthase